MATAAIAAIATAGITYFATGSILAAVVMAGLSAIGYFLSPKPKIESEVKPASLSDFSITQAQEGIPIPLIYGQVTIPGNLIYYGNLVTERVTENVETGGGKGGHHHSSTQVTKGYKYYLDVWQAIAEGKITLLEYYRDNDPSKKVEAQDVIWNDGTMDTYPTHLELANRLPGVAHIFFKKLYCGFNRTYLPTIYFKIVRDDEYVKANLFDVTRSEYDNVNLSVSHYISHSYNVVLSKDGTKLFAADYYSNTIHQWNLSVAFDISSAQYYGSFHCSEITGNHYSPFCFSFNGKFMYVANADENIVYQYELAIAWDITTASYTGKSFNFSSFESLLRSIVVSYSGEYFYIVGDSRRVIYQFNLTTPFDISTAIYSERSYNISNLTTENVRQISFSEDGTILLIAANSHDATIYQLNLTEAWKIDTAIYSNQSYYVGNMGDDFHGCHIVYDKMKFYTIDNGSDIIFQFKVNYPPTNGMNPADILYDLLVNQAGINKNYIDLISFKVAKQYFASKEIGLNYAITSTRKIKDIVEEICNLCNCILKYNENGQIELVIFDNLQESKAIIEDEFISFELSKPSINELPNDFKANFVDRDTNTVKTIHLENLALKEASGKVNSVTYDLTMINNEETALKILSNIIKKESYPKMTLRMKLPLKYSFLNIGDIVYIKNSELGLEGEFRILGITEEIYKEQSVELTLLQNSEIEIDNINENIIGNSSTRDSSQININLVPFQNIKIFELDYTNIYKDTPAFLILVSREIGIETGFAVYYSFTGSDYKLYGIFDTFSSVGELTKDYPNSTYEIDDVVGIQFKLYNDFDFHYDNISRTDLFTTRRFAIIGNELLTFQNINPVGDTDYLFTGVVRGLNWSAKESHNIGDKIFISEFDNNVLSGSNFSTPFYLKIVPVFGNKTLSLEDVEPIYVEPTMKARRPITPEKVIATRDNSNPANVNVDVFVVSKTSGIGAGKNNPDTTTDQYPFEYEGIIVAQINDEPEMYFDSPNFTIENRPEAFTLKIKTRWNGFDSNVITVNVPNSGNNSGNTIPYWYEP